MQKNKIEDIARNKELLTRLECTWSIATEWDNEHSTIKLAVCLEDYFRHEHASIPLQLTMSQITSHYVHIPHAGQFDIREESLQIDGPFVLRDIQFIDQHRIRWGNFL